MKTVILFLLYAVASVAQTITGLSYQNLSHGSVRINATLTGYTGQTQVLIIKSSNGSCQNANGSGIYANDWVEQGTDNRGGNNATYWVIGGLAANTSYNICPQVWNGNWVGGQQITITTTSLPAIHPVPPIPAASYTPTYPNTTGYATVDLTGNCTPTSLQNAFQAGATNQASNQGTFILIPAGTQCWDQGQNGLGHAFDIEIDQPDFHNFGASDIHLDSGTTDTAYITTPNCCNTSGSANPISEGTQVVIGGEYGIAYPAMTGAGVGCKVGFQPGMHYFAHVLSTSTFSLYCDSPKNSGGSYMAITNTGNASCSTSGSCNLGSRFIWVTVPRKIPWIIVTNGVSDAQYVPFGARTNPTISLAMNGTFRHSYPSQGSGQVPAYFTIGNLDGGDKRPLGRIWIRGMNFINDFSEVSVDPLQVNNTLTIPEAANEIVLDRVYWTYTGTTRCCAHTGIGANGNDVYIVGSWFDKVAYARYDYNGMGVSTSGNTVSVGAGQAGMVAGSVTTTNTANFTLGGSGSGSWFVFTDFLGGLDLAAPPGITANCSGITSCNPMLQDTTGGITNGTAGTFPASNMGGSQVLIDPVFSTSSSCATTENLWGPSDPQTGNNTTGGGSEWGFRFQVSRAGYICGMRMYKTIGDSATTRTFHWWGTGTSIVQTATTSGEPSAGWVTGTFATPISVSPGYTYVGSYTGPTGSTAAYIVKQNQNWGARSFVNGNNGSIMQIGYYTSAANGCDQNFDGPKDWLGNGYAMPLACGTLSSPSALTITAYGVRGDGTTNYATEGSNFDAATHGPGPLDFENNYTSAVGLIWHFMDEGSGGPAYGNDYTVKRSYFTTPMTYLPLSPTSDHNYYVGRQLIEFKGGSRVLIAGNIFDGCLLSVSSGGCIETTPVSDTSSDHWYRSNIFMHANAAIMGPGGEPGNYTAQVHSRIWYTNNVAWDIDGLAYKVRWSGKTSRGSFILSWYNNGEDIVVDHNTVASQNGTLMETFSPTMSKIEGVKVTNNIFQANYSGWYFFSFQNLSNSIQSSVCGDPAANVEAAMMCTFSPNSVFKNNVLIPGNINNTAANAVPSPGGVTQAQVQSWFPQTHTGVSGNYIPASGDLTNFGWWNFNEAYTSNQVNGNPHNFQFRVKPSSQVCSGCTYKGTDGTDVGADIPSMNVEMGIVETYSVTGITTSSATVNFLAPDSAGCPVQYSTDPNFVSPRPSMVNDAGGARSRSLAITGLTTKNTYYVRINCQDTRGQPVTSFTTN